MSLLEYFTNPVYQASTIGSMLMCLCTSLIGVLVLLQKRSLIGEVLSHSAYPGIAFGVILFSVSTKIGSFTFLAIALLGALVSCLLGFFSILMLEKKAKVYPDAALCFTLASFLGIGVLLTSIIQQKNPILVSQIQVFLYGQVATMTWMYVWMYVLFTICLSLCIVFLYPRWKIYLLDKQFAQSIGIPTRKVEALTTLLIAFAIVIGLRAAGVILISAMLIAPALFAKQLTNRLSLLFILSGLGGLLSGFLGNVLSIKVPQIFSVGQGKFSVPTGPIIVLVAIALCILSILFSPKKGQLLRYCRRVNFQYKCAFENLLKCFWKRENHILSKREIYSWSLSGIILYVLVWDLRFRKLIEPKEKGIYTLTDIGLRKAEKIVRIHRLWEVYLFKYLGYCEKKVHASAEEMEHIITPELEEKLNQLLDYPTLDPHNQPIPGGV